MIASPNKLYLGVRGTFANLASANKWDYSWLFRNEHFCHVYLLWECLQTIFSSFQYILTTDGWGAGTFLKALCVWLSLKLRASIPPEAIFKYCNQKYSGVHKTI